MPPTSGCGFLSANLYARSLFDEDAFANLSIAKDEQGVLQGHIRIRSKTQVWHRALPSLSLGDRITSDGITSQRKTGA
ncbi:hypothetical protein RQP46_010261 [Phenoliferia psychrophenolica]